MSFTDWLFTIGFISEDTWRDKSQKKNCSFCNKYKSCTPWGAWAHQYGRYCDWICEKCKKKKL